MPIRKVEVYDRPLPSFEETFFGDASNPLVAPKESWKEQLTPGELALFVVDAKTSAPRDPETGKFGGRVCFAGPEKEVLDYARSVRKRHPHCVCRLHLSDGREIKSMPRRASHAEAMVGIAILLLLIAVLLALPGLAVVFALHFLLPSLRATRISTLEWTFAVVASVLICGGIPYLIFKHRVQRRVKSVGTLFSRAEERQFNQLMSTGKQEDRDEARLLWRELQQRCRDRFASSHNPAPPYET